MLDPIIDAATDFWEQRLAPFLAGTRQSARTRLARAGRACHTSAPVFPAVAGVGALLVALVAVSVVFGRSLHAAHAEAETYAERELAAERRLQDMNEQLRYKERYLQRLLDDPEFVDAIAREKLGLVRPDEVLFRFRKPQQAPR